MVNIHVTVQSQIEKGWQKYIEERLLYVFLKVDFIKYENILALSDIEHVVSKCQANLIRIYATVERIFEKREIKKKEIFCVSDKSIDEIFTLNPI